MLRVHEVTEASDEVVEALARLLPQLSRSAPAPTSAQVAGMVASSSTVLFVARKENAPGQTGPIVGTLTLAVFRIPSGLRAWIEDVITDEAARGQGCGEALTRAALEHAARRGARTVDLTSRPSREAANRLYVRMGFELRETNVYRRALP